MKPSRLSYVKELLEKLKGIAFKEQGPVGDSPTTWAEKMGLEVNFTLPDKTLTRAEVRAICMQTSNDPLLGYICAMAWGGQGQGPAGVGPAKNAWQARNEIKKRIQMLRYDSLCRSEAYALFAGSNKVPGLGPAYFTKLLYFFCPDDPVDRYIMDQWTTKPVILLTSDHIIRHQNGVPAPTNTGDNYELFCRVVEELARLLGVETSERMEERLFSVGSIKGQPRGEWRQVVVDAWGDGVDLPRYNHGLIRSILRGE